MAILPATISAQEPDTRCDEAGHPNRLESVLCNWSELAENQSFEAYAINRSYSLIGPLERYILLANIDGEWSLQAVGFQREVKDNKFTSQTYKMTLEDISVEEAAKIKSRFSDAAWSAIEDTFVQNIDKICLDGSVLNTYRYRGDTLETLSQHDCYGQSGLTDLADGLAKHIIEQEPDIAPFIACFF